MVLRYCEACIHRLRGYPEAALEALRKTEGLTISRPSIALDLSVRWVEFLREAGHDEQAAERASKGLHLLELPVGEPFTCFDRLEKGRMLATHLDALGANKEAHRAYDIVAAAVLEHIAQLDSCAKSLPELGLGSDAQLQELVDARKRFVEEQHEILRRVAALLERDEGGVARVLATEDDGFVRICAWCERLKPKDGAWLPLGNTCRARGPSTSRTACVPPA